MSQKEFIATVRRSPWFFLGGVVVFVFGLFLNESLVTMTGMIGVMVGASISGMGRGILKKGMWFLAAIFWLPTVLIYLGIAYLQFGSEWNQASSILRWVALGVATWLLGVQSRLLLTVLKANWKLSKQ